MSLNYLVVRLAQILPTFLLIMVVAFVLVRLLPGDPTSAILGLKATDADVLRLNAEYGLDKPIPVQFLFFLRNFFQGNLGESIILKVPVMSLILQRLPVTLLLSAFAGLLALLLAVPLAFLAALNRDARTDAIIRVLFQIGLSMPVFYVGPRAAAHLRRRSALVSRRRILRRPGRGLYHLFLPALTLALSLAAVLMRSLRAAILEVLHAEFVDFATAKGLSRRLVLLPHVLRNALIATVTLFGLNIGSLLGGAVITESSLPSRRRAADGRFRSSAATTR